jgi:hypothetical protein
MGIKTCNMNLYNIHSVILFAYMTKTTTFTNTNFLIYFCPLSLHEKSTISEPVRFIRKREKFR